MKPKDDKKEKRLLSGNEAIARGAYEAGVKVASAYPGTPSTEILENLSTYQGIYTEWAPNEKVAVEVALGASFAGVRAMASMKHVGLNVAADPLFTAAYTGVRGGLIIITADDPEMHSSQNEQDNRNYAFAAKVPMLEPADASEAKELIKTAYRISEEFDTPVLFRTTTRVSHVKGIVSIGEMEKSSINPGIEKMPEKFVMLPAHARRRRIELGKRMIRLREFAETFPGNRIEWGNKEKGFITSGVSYLYVKEAFPEASVLKLGMVYPLPEKLIRDFAEKVGELFIVEELDPFIELHVKAMGIPCRGKELIPAMGELNPRIVRASITGGKTDAVFEPVPIPMRPPNLCPGCPHRGIFYALSKLGLFVAGDIGCYTLAFMKPLSGLHSCICMGASIGMAHGMSKALGEKGRGKVVGVIGDSTFLHSGITPLLNMAYNRSNALIIICDNRTTAMTGMQEHPGTGVTIQGEKTFGVDLKKLVEALGVESVRVMDPYDLEMVNAILKEELAREGPSVVISRRSCVLFKRHREPPRKPLNIDAEQCTGCRLCLALGCPAIKWKGLPPSLPEGNKGKSRKKKGFAVIDQHLCTGCGLCRQICKAGAIREEL